MQKVGSSLFSESLPMPSQGSNVSISSSSPRSNPVPIHGIENKHEKSKHNIDIEYVKKHYEAKTW